MDTRRSTVNRRVFLGTALVPAAAALVARHAGRRQRLIRRSGHEISRKGSGARPGAPRSAG